MLSGEVLEVDEPHKLVLTFQPHWDEEAEKAGFTSRVTYEIVPTGRRYGQAHPIARRTRSVPAITPGFRDGWALIFSGLKTLLETGQPLPAVPTAM